MQPEELASGKGCPRNAATPAPVRGLPASRTVKVIVVCDLATCSPLRWPPLPTDKAPSTRSRPAGTRFSPRVTCLGATQRARPMTRQPGLRHNRRFHLGGSVTRSDRLTGSRTGHEPVTSEKPCWEPERREREDGGRDPSQGR